MHVHIKIDNVTVVTYIISRAVGKALNEIAETCGFGH